MPNNPEKKNLALFHLESVSNTILWQYRVELPTVWRLMQQSQYFTRFYTGSTSTEMSMMDIVYGTPVIFDHLARFGGPNSQPYQDVMGALKVYLKFDHGYHEIDAMCNYFGGKCSDDTYESERQIRHVRPDIIASSVTEALQQCKAENRPFYLAFNNNVSHMALDDDATIAAQTFTDRFKIGYQRLDASVNSILAILAGLGLWENTLIVLYGDHGDELWSHALNKGYCHCIAPYASLAWTPLLIYDNGRNVGFDDRLMSAVDVRETVINMLYPGYVPKADIVAKLTFDAVPFAGHDINNKPREFAFSQNLFALQLEYSDLEQALTKAYAVTDGIYRLVVSSGGRRPKDGGLEFFYDRLDPTNSRNLLDFFIVGVDGDIVSYLQPAEIDSDSDFSRVFTPDAVRHMQESYRRLKRELHEYVRAKEATALLHNQREYHVMPDSAFKQARRRIRRDYDE